MGRRERAPRLPVAGRPRPARVRQPRPARRARCGRGANGAHRELASVEQLSCGRLTAGLALGGWPEDYAASEAPLAGRGAAFEQMLATMRRVWAGEVTGAGGPIPKLPSGRPALLLGGLVPAAFARVAALADGWGRSVLRLRDARGRDRLRGQAWIDAGRPGRPRIVADRYFCLGPRADDVADHYLMHYYGQESFAYARADTLTTPAAIRTEVGRLSEAGCDDLLLFPSSGDVDQECSWFPDRSHLSSAERCSVAARPSCDRLP